MSRRRRAALLLGLALVLGGLAASDMSRREAALRDQLSPVVDVLVARRPLEPGHRVRNGDLAVRAVPARFAPPDSPVLPALVVGRRLAVPVASGGAVAPDLMERPQGGAAIAVGRGERAAEVVAAAAPDTVVPGARVDVLVTRDAGDGARGATRLALQDVEVLATRDAPAGDDPHQDGGRLIAATLRVTLRQAVFLSAAGAFAREIRLLARAPGDRGRVSAVVAGG
jgi:pilus assembly protein CpaB